MRETSTRSTKRWSALVAIALAAAGVACPIQRPSVPAEFYPFRAELEAAVAETALVVMEGRPATQERLHARLPELAAILTTDSLLRTLEADSLLRRLADPVSAKLGATLRSEETARGARAAFRNPDGQRQGVDAILIGLATALRRLRAGYDPPPPPGSDARRTCSRRGCSPGRPGFVVGARRGFAIARRATRGAARFTGSPGIRVESRDPRAPTLIRGSFQLTLI